MEVIRNKRLTKILCINKTKLGSSVLNFKSEVLHRWKVLLNIKIRLTKLSKLKEIWRDLKLSFIEEILAILDMALSRWWVDSFMMDLRLLD